MPSIKNAYLPLLEMRYTSMWSSKTGNSALLSIRFFPVEQKVNSNAICCLIINIISSTEGPYNIGMYSLSICYACKHQNEESTLANPMHPHDCLTYLMRATEERAMSVTSIRLYDVCTILWLLKLLAHVSPTEFNRALISPSVEMCSGIRAWRLDPEKLTWLL